ncbi:MAG TPA: L-threonylcarbamoyladenylate synthase, partial [Myxococcaceae bacterium]|nr:L-threonylcarbamoyladenylate synthase [Myxococcaceae bacterium]
VGMSQSEAIADAVRVLRRGGLVAVPTETVYGLGADAESEAAILRVFAVKRRPTSHPLIVHLGAASWLPLWARKVPPAARKLAEAFWPGPLTLVLPRSGRVLDAITGGQDTVALRVPAHPLMRQLLAAFGRGIAAPSANRFGKVSPTTAEHVRSELGEEVDFVLDGGPCTIGIESTIVDLSGGSATVLRPGGVPQEELERVLGQPLPFAGRSNIRAPGLFPSHYAPSAQVVLAATSEVPGSLDSLRSAGRKVALISPQSIPLPESVRQFLLSSDEAAFARALYATLREVDRQGFDAVVVVPPKDVGLGAAVRDRLIKAAAKRP